ncbi:hypothetical protein TVAG_128990 [Trichomonas vaginalis G3]|uniref:t-SNARE coiled-coil homology domain-containing protein n=1 Tax=Trichomonas vaginalis (strain ATCC PRA-98 / G3) TaxID=412133 RepID=A2E4F0_TRIV3|nr:syntaxin-16 family [Trichomonas vaginalis G3]EAY12485.1 hypothetical protein TVAG_128990 [Trichomonas vaginalis G3]KAI5539546.1 syntaxin-16 family [Trichomonas vaginalis G3]|eukprot:XP_001324708.1 hypothetical protein [Trichomonas vaginalis G3]
MSLKKGANQSLEERIKAFAQRINTLEKNSGSLSNSMERKNVRSQLLNLKKLDQDLAKEFNTYNKPDKEALEAHYKEVKDKYMKLNQELEQECVRYEEEEKKKQAEREERDRQDAEARQKQQQMSELDQETAEINFVDNQVKDILEDEKALNEATELLNTRIQEQHEVVVRVDNTVEEAKTEMEEGNKELNEAQKLQPKCRIC